MKKRARSNQRQAELFSEPQSNDSPSLFDVPADRSQELEAALGELLLKAVSKIEHGKGGEHDV
jgi:hypothetical protein